MNGPLVSVVIPVYNRADTIQKAVRSVLDQTYKNIELIVVDDGSTDDTLKVLGQIQDRNMKVLKQDHKGANAARNLGVCHSKGEYVAFNDSADIWDACKIGRQLACMQEEAGRDLVFCSEIIHNLNESYVFPSEEQKALIKQGKICEVLARGNCVDTPTIFCKRSCFTVVGEFDAALPRCQEYEWILRFVQKCTMHFLDECLVESYIRADSITSDISKLLAAMPEIYSRHRNFFAQYGTEADFLIAPVYELYGRGCSFAYYEKYFELLSNRIDGQDRPVAEEAHMRTMRLLFSENVNKKYRIKNLRDGCDIDSILKKGIPFNIFGAGGVAKAFYEYLQRNDLANLVGNVIVTSVEGNDTLKDGVPLVELETCDDSVKKRPLILAVNNLNILEVIEKIEAAGFEKIVVSPGNGQK